MPYRTKTYIAADWDNDENAVKALMDWNKQKNRGLSFGDAHEISKCISDSTNNCNIKKNCSQNLDYSKHFVLIVGNNTKKLCAGYCMYCKSYRHCINIYKTNKSFVEFECDYAVRNNLPIIVLYYSLRADKNKCIDSVIYRAKCHTPMLMRKWDGTIEWDYQGIKAAFDKLG